MRYFRELLSTVPNPLLVDPKPTTKSETHVLFEEDLQEDSSGDDYVPDEEEVYIY